MVAAIRSSGSEAIYPTSSGSSLSGLEAQLASYQKELSNCVNCDSANTAQGKETIQAVSNKINSIKARIEAQKNAQQARHVTLNVSASNQPQAGNIPNTPAATAAYPEGERKGRHIDIKA